MELKVQQKIQVSARVFRAKKHKPKYVPQCIWRMCIKNKLWFAGRWENLGVIATN